MTTVAGRRVLVTGGSRGIGLEVARSLADRGARVMAVARRPDELASAVASLPGGPHDWVAADVGDAEGWPPVMGLLRDGLPLAGVVTAAGVLAPVGELGSYEPDEFWDTVRVNLLGTFLTLHHCLSLLEAAKGAAVTFSGGGGTAPLPRFDAYAASKAAVIRLTENISAVVREKGIRVNCVAPGFIATRMHETTLAAGPYRAGPAYVQRTQRELAAGGAPVRHVADLVCMLLGPEAAAIHGKLISAQWDPWTDPAYRERLAAEPDLATLRRIDGEHFQRCL